MGKENKARRTGAVSKKKQHKGAACVYCGSILDEREAWEKPLMVKVKKQSFPVCSQGCQEATQRYLEKDKKYKTPLYLLIFIAAIVTLVTAIFSGPMLPVHAMQILVGLAFILWPYPVSAFTTFENNSILTVIRISRVVGVILAVSGVIFLLAALL